MAPLVRLSRVEGDSLPEGNILKAADYDLIESSRQVLDDARRQAQEIIDAAEHELQARREQGYREGADQARMELAEQMIDTVTRAVDYFTTVEEDVTGVVVSAVRKIIGELDDVELMRRVVRNALQVARAEKKITLRVCPEQEGPIRERVGAILEGFSGVGFLEVVADHRLSKGGCILETELGVVDASVETQLQALEKALRSRIGARRE
jgi:type III secretion protein L